MFLLERDLVREAGRPLGVGEMIERGARDGLVTITFAWSCPEGWLATPKPTLARGSHANRSSRILNSLQTFRVCRSTLITLVRSGGPSKQCREDLTVLPTLKLGLLPFLIVLLSSRLSDLLHLWAVASTLQRLEVSNSVSPECLLLEFQRFLSLVPQALPPRWPLLPCSVQITLPQRY
jgi:hypothetical protein